MKTLIKNGHLIDPAAGKDGSYDLLIEKGKVSAVEPNGSLSESESKNLKVIDAAGLIVAPGFIDAHVHFREPGFEYKETIQTGCESAAAGGFTSVAVMPNTEPVNDNRAVTEMMLAQAEEKGIVNVFAIGAITRGLEGQLLSDMADLHEAGVIAYSDDGRPVMNSELMRRAFEFSKMFDLPCIQHSEDLNLTQGGSMNEGLVSTELGLRGMPTVAEDIMVYRDIALLPLTGGRHHVAHISSGNAVELVRLAKAKGLPVTCEVAPHHFTLTQDSVRGFNVDAKMSPPLRTAKDIEAIKEGLKDGTIDIIATDHAPHDVTDKQVEFVHSCFGIVGLETALPLSLKLVEEEILTLPQMVEKFTAKPAEVFALDRGTLSVGKTADIVIFDPDIEYHIDKTTFKSRSKNTPFDGWRVKGKALYTLVSGKIVFAGSKN